MLLLTAAFSAVVAPVSRSAVSSRRLSPPQLSAAPKSEEFATFRAAEDRLRQIHATSPRRSAEPQSSAAALPNDEFRDFREAEARLRRIHWHNFRAAEARLRRLAIPSNDEWRDFRARLIAGAVGAAPAVKPTTPNAAKLRQQDEALWNEYARGVWAHATGVAEPGGLLCALPIQAQIVQAVRNQGADASSYWARTLRARLAGYYGSLSRMDEVLRSGGSSAAYSLALRSATSMVDDALHSMRTRAIPRREERELWQMQCRALDTRRQVALVLDTHRASGACVAVALNKPVASRIDASLARRLLEGRDHGDRTEEDVDALVEKLVAAFGFEAAVYWGGPEGQGRRGLVVHGVGELEGARELAQGTKLYHTSALDGFEAAADAVLDGRAPPLAFRWFLGRHMALSARSGEWLPVACSRPLILKQSARDVAMPTPLWHEVLELCGGECRELSRLVDRENQGDGGRRGRGNNAEDTPGR